jgi:hypothetical protein
MALLTRITDAGADQPRTMPNGWGWWHVERMAEVIRTEGNLPDDVALLTVLNQCPWTVEQEHTFTDPTDGEVLVLSPGDVLDAWRDR